MPDFDDTGEQSVPFVPNFDDTGSEPIPQSKEEPETPAAEQDSEEDLETEPSGAPVQSVTVPGR